MLQLRNRFYILVLALLFDKSQIDFPEVIERLHKSVIRLPNTFAPSFKKRPDRFSKPAALDTLVFLKIVKIVFSD